MRSLIALLLVACGPSPTPAPTPTSTPAPAHDPAVAPTPAPTHGPAPTPADAPPILAAHNQYRAAHCAGALTWSDDLAAEAQRWADTLASRDCAFEHNMKSPHGENLAFFGPPGSLSAEDVAAMWYGERKVYDFARPGFSFEAGHFTQMVWVATREVGCASVQCGDGELWVCNYAPAGNVESQFERNVLPTSCK